MDKNPVEEKVRGPGIYTGSGCLSAICDGSAEARPWPEKVWGTESAMYMECAQKKLRWVFLSVFKGCPKVHSMIISHLRGTVWNSTMFRPYRQIT